MNKLVKLYRFLLPFETLTISTNLAFSEVLQKLDEIVEPPKTWRMALPFQKPNKPYGGTITGNTFRISRNIHYYRNSFLPIITGEIYPQTSGCYVKIKMNLHIAVLVFMIFWLWTPGSIGMLALLAWLVDRSVGPIFLPLFGMCIFAWSLCLFGFKIEAQKSVKFFSSLFTSSSEKL
ncbi:MAG: hypothetical protein MUE44_32915 [Oscillatoriaceae cyanobacterium Prado104]|jgi:hypothetical protein|nr:hypothetical protein [Oscillatoriaceae cyanobacterium Prado104]